MSRRSRRRDTRRIAKQSLPTVISSTFTRRYPVSSYSNDYVSQFSRRQLKLVGDRRVFHPERDKRPVAARERSNRSLRAVTFEAPVIAAFSKPSGVFACVRRKIRREVLHAKRKTGSSGQKPGKWNWLSYLSCGRRRK